MLTEQCTGGNSVNCKTEQYSGCKTSVCENAAAAVRTCPSLAFQKMSGKSPNISTYNCCIVSSL